MLEASSAIMMMTGMLITPEITVAVTMSAPGKSVSDAKTPQARVAPTGAENTALKIVASSAEASRTSPVLWRTNSWLPPVPSTFVVKVVPPPARSSVRHARLTAWACRIDSRTQSNTSRQCFL